MSFGRPQRSERGGGPSRADTQPIEGKEYEIYLGDSFFEDDPQQKYHTLRYMHKPISVANFSTPGTIHMRTDSKEVNLDLPTDNEKTVRFTGQLQYPKQGGNECVLIFQGDSFRLERLTSKINGLKPKQTTDSKSSNKSASTSKRKSIKRTDMAHHNASNSSPTQTCNECQVEGTNMFACSECGGTWHKQCAYENGSPTSSWLCVMCKQKMISKQRSSRAGGVSSTSGAPTGYAANSESLFGADSSDEEIQSSPAFKNKQTGGADNLGSLKRGHPSSMYGGGSSKSAKLGGTFSSNSNGPQHHHLPSSSSLGATSTSTMNPHLHHHAPIRSGPYVNGNQQPNLMDGMGQRPGGQHFPSSGSNMNGTHHSTLDTSDIFGGHGSSSQVESGSEDSDSDSEDESGLQHFMNI